jgi:hypothetical protein
MRGDIQMIIFKIATVGILSAAGLMAMLSTGFGSEFALAIISLI